MTPYPTTRYDRRENSRPIEKTPRRMPIRPKNNLTQRHDFRLTFSLLVFSVSGALTGGLVGGLIFGGWWALFHAIGGGLTGLTFAATSWVARRDAPVD